MAALVGALTFLAVVVADGGGGSVTNVQEEAKEPDEALSLPAPVPSLGVWDRLAQCESTGRWNANTGNGFYGGLQFLLSTWRANTGTGFPHLHSRAEQIRVAQIVQARYGWGQWPVCSRRLGLR